MQFGEQGTVGDEPVLNDFRHASREFASGQGGEQSRVGKDRGRLMKITDEVFTGGEVDTRLPAHRAIDHCQERRRDLIEIDTPLVGGSRKTSEVTDHAAADREECPVTGDAVFREKIPDPGEFGRGLGLLAVGRRDIDRHALLQGLQKFRTGRGDGG